MSLKKLKAKCWAKKQTKKNLMVKTPVNCEAYIHSADKKALEALKKIPLLDTVCGKILPILNDACVDIITKASLIRINEKQIPKIYFMVKSICNKIGIKMPEIYLELNREVNAFVYGTEKYTLIINSGLLECLEDDEIYAVLAHECGHIACKHSLYYSVASMVLGYGRIGLEEIGAMIGNKGVLGSIFGGVLSAVDSALELAFYQWYRYSELSADRVAAICCGSAKPVVETMIRLAGGTTQIGAEINKELFIEQAKEYKEIIDKSSTNKFLEFLLTKNDTHPLLAVRAYEVEEFAKRDIFKEIK